MDYVLAADLSTFMHHSAYCVKLQQLVVLWWWLNLFIQWCFVHAELHITDLQKKIWQNICNILRGKKSPVPVAQTSGVVLTARHFPLANITRLDVSLYNSIIIPYYTYFVVQGWQVYIGLLVKMATTRFHCYSTVHSWYSMLNNWYKTTRMY